MHSQVRTIATGAKPDTPHSPARWAIAAIEDLFALPFNDLLRRAHERIARITMQMPCSPRCSIRPRRPEDARTARAARYHTGVSEGAAPGGGCRGGGWGANSIFYGDKLLTTGNPDVEADQALFTRLGLRTR
jgi:hypothetical protein